MVVDLTHRESCCLVMCHFLCYSLSTVIWTAYVCVCVLEAESKEEVIHCSPTVKRQKWTTTFYVEIVIKYSGTKIFMIIESNLPVEPFSFICVPLAVKWTVLFSAGLNFFTCQKRWNITVTRCIKTVHIYIPMKF